MRKKHGPLSAVEVSIGPAIATPVDCRPQVAVPGSALLLEVVSPVQSLRHAGAIRACEIKCWPGN